MPLMVVTTVRGGRGKKATRTVKCFPERPVIGSQADMNPLYGDKPPGQGGFMDRLQEHILQHPDKWTNGEQP